MSVKYWFYNRGDGLDSLIRGMDYRVAACCKKVVTADEGFVLIKDKFPMLGRYFAHSVRILGESTIKHEDVWPDWVPDGNVYVYDVISTSGIQCVDHCIIKPPKQEMSVSEKECILSYLKGN